MKTKPMKNFDVSIDERGVMSIGLNVPGRPLNVLTHDVMGELTAIVDDLEKDQSCRLAVFQSSKESGFLAGADVAAIANIHSDSLANELLEQGQSLFQRIERLPFPTIAVIHGPCLGGGLELSLACTYRVARDNSSTQLGLPEIKLGLIPGWGGTQRLPRLVGLTQALSMILSGRSVSASEAHRMGLVDRAIDPEHWDESVATFIDEALDGAVKRGTPLRLDWRRVLESTPVGRTLILRSTKRRLASKAHHYPALAAAMKAIRKAFESSEDGFLCEREEFVKLLATPTCRQLLELFFARERARTQATWTATPDAIHLPPIRTIGVVGAGAMGAGIGHLAGVRGYDVILKEIDPQTASMGRDRINQLIDDDARRRGLDGESKAAIARKITVSCEDSALADCDLVIEAVVEREEVKEQVFQTLDGIVQPAAILASNTSSLSVTKMAEATRRAPLVAGLHFFNPVHRMELVEVVRTPQSGEATIARLVNLVRALGKTPIVTADSPGFLVNRVLFPYLGEAILMVGDGIDVAEVDRQIRHFGMPMGPLELLDQVGLDVALHVASSLEGVLPEVAPVVDRLAVLVDRGSLGKKSSNGFYRYRKGKRQTPARLPISIFAEKPRLDRDDFAEDGLTIIQRRLIYPLLIEAVRCFEEGVVRSPWAIDLAMVLGTGFAPHRGGPLHVIDSIGSETIQTNLERLKEQLGHRFSVPERLMEMSRSGERFFATEHPSGERSARAEELIG